MKEFFDKRIIVFALPGAFALFSAGFVSDLPSIRDSQLPFVYFLLSLCSLSIPFLLAYLYLSIKKSQATISQVLYNTYFLVALLISSIGVGLSFGIIHNYDVGPQSLRRLLGANTAQIYSQNELIRELFSRAYSDQFPDGRFDPKTDYDVLPEDPFDTSNRYARIMMPRSDLIYEGVVVLYHTGNNKPQVYLSPVCRLSSSHSPQVIRGSGVWISLENADAVEFIDARCSPCAEAHVILSERPINYACPYD